MKATTTIFIALAILFCVAATHAVIYTKCQTKAIIEDMGLWTGDDIRKLTCLASLKGYRSNYYESVNNNDNRYGIFGISDGTINNPPGMTGRWCYATSSSGLCGQSCTNIMEDDTLWFATLCAFEIYTAWNNTFLGFPQFALRVNGSCSPSRFSISNC